MAQSIQTRECTVSSSSKTTREIHCHMCEVMEIVKKDCDDFRMQNNILQVQLGEAIVNADERVIRVAEGEGVLQCVAPLNDNLSQPSDVNT